MHGLKWIVVYRILIVANLTMINFAMWELVYK
jgi:hypothetical protein